jgi:NAD(P)-dependent dehydrogenase (short-subunit alcohol dehydrogenase family)
VYPGVGVQHVDATETGLDDWAASLAVNLSGVFYLAKYGIPALHRVGGGVIITTASEYGLLGARRSVGYCATKAGIINLTRALAVDHAGQNIRANCIVPGPIATERGLALFQEDPGLAEAQDRLILLGRNGDPSEIASVAAFLASEQSSFMTGSVLRVDGGATSWYSV